MNISRTDLDALNATININLKRSDFQEKVTEVLTSTGKQLTYLDLEKDMFQWV